MNENRCPQCDAELPANAPRGLCPACLLKGGLETDRGVPGGDAASGASDYTPPTPAELAALFPELEIIEFIGRGGMGMVYKARQKRLDRLVALKILTPTIGRDPAFAERFIREARAMAMLNHPHIVTVYDFGQTLSPRPPGEGQGVRAGAPPGDGADGTRSVPATLYYFLMEFVDGVNLRRLLENRRFTPLEALAIVPQICDALQYAHDKGVVHRDIKPENLLLDKSGQLKIADFGLAKLVGQPLQATSLTETNQVMGTPHYMAPEQLEHPQEVDHRADIYSLGVVFYQMLTGELPIGRFAPPSQKVHIDVRLDEVVLRTLEKEPQRRYQQASQVKTEVETIASSRPGPSSPAVDLGPPPVAPRHSIRPLPDARFSRTAIAGVVWAPLLFVVVLFMFQAKAVSVSPGGPPPGPEWWQWALIFTVLPLGLAAPVGTTVLGLIATSQIRNSAGCLCGLALAVFDMLLYPLLLLDGLIGCVWSVATYFLNEQMGPPSPLSPDACTKLIVLLTLLASALTDVLLVRWTWRAVTRADDAIADKARRPADAPPPDASAAVFAWIALGLFLTGLLGGFLVEVFSYGAGPPFAIVCAVLAVVFAILGRRHAAGKVVLIGMASIAAIGGVVALATAIYLQTRAPARPVHSTAPLTTPPHITTELPARSNESPPATASDAQAARIAALQKAFDVDDARYRMGTVDSLERIAALDSLLSAQLAAAEKKTDRIAFCKKLLDCHREKEKILEARWKQGIGSEVDWLQAKSDRMKAESLLAKESGGPPPSETPPPLSPFEDTRAIVLGAMEYSMEHAVWPEHIEEMRPRYFNLEVDLRRFVYRPPTAEDLETRPLATPVVWDKEPNSEGGRVVGFADGYVEYIPDRNRLEKLLPKTDSAK